MLNADEEILQDFLTEAGELLESLSEQLVALENQPNDTELLNAIFRGFHTVKGGAGFLQLEPLVETCHIAENVFDILRNGKRQVTPELMDVVLQALDTVNEQFDCVRERQQPEHAEPQLLKDLAKLAEPEEEGADNPQEVEAQPEVSASDELWGEHCEQPVNTDIASDDGLFIDVETDVAATTGGDEITEQEFEDLLNKLHGSGVIQGAKEGSSEGGAQANTSAGANSNNITDDEFEDLLDQMYGAGKGPGSGEGDEKSDLASPDLVQASEENKTEQIKENETSPSAAPSPLSPPNPISSSANKSVEPVSKDNMGERSKAKKTSSPKSSPGKDAIAAAEATVRVDTARLDEIMNMVGELVLVRNRLVRLGLDSGDEVMSKAVANLDVVTADLQMAVMKTRMQPIKKVFGRFPRVVRDLARSLKKEIQLELIGEETDLDKNLVEALADPLVHLVRNAVDHGIEQPDEREKNNKPRQGTVVLSAQQEGDHILLGIRDDGGGMNAAKLKVLAVERGVIDQDAADRLTDKECYNLIFLPGFSTKDEISDISGRGVGMDVVKTKINQLNGTTDIDSTPGQGTQITIKVPLTLAIMPTLMVMLEDQAFAFPLVSVSEIFHLDLSRTNIVDGQEVIIVRDKALPLFYLKRWLINENNKGCSSRSDQEEKGHVLVVNVGTKRVGFVVDQLIGQEEVVIKPLGKMLQGTAGMAGATITGDGRIALILDIPSLLNKYARRISLQAA